MVKGTIVDYNAIVSILKDALEISDKAIGASFERRKVFYLLSGGDELAGFIDFHKGDNRLSMPGKDQVLLSSGAAENLGIREGDELILRNGDLEELHLTVSGVYDNHI